MRKHLLSLLFLGLLCHSVYAATEFVSTMNKTGEDYNTIALWEDALDESGDLTATDIKVFSHGGVTGTLTDGDFVTGKTSGAAGFLRSYTSTQVLIDAITTGPFQSGEQVYNVVDTDYVTISDAGDSPIVVLEIYDDDGIIAAGGTIDGFTTSATNYVKVTVPSGERHNGIAGGGAGSGVELTANITVADNYTIIEWIEFDGAGWGVSGSVTDPVLRYSIIHDRATSCLVGPQYGTLYLNNSIIYDCTGTWSVGVKPNATFGDVHAENVTVDRPNYYGMTPDGGSSDFSCQNCYSGDPIRADAFAYGTLTAPCTYNAAGDDTADDCDATGALNNISNSTSFVSVTDGSEDYHISSSSVVLVDAGIDLGTTRGVNIDIDNYDRDSNGSTWDIGADEGFEATVIPTKINESILGASTIAYNNIQCYPKDWYAKQEAGKCKIGRKWISYN